MYFSSWQEFLHMGGYAFYVWISYGLTLLVLAGLLLALWMRHRRLRQELVWRARREQRRNEVEHESHST
jgi:heme exporter protein D